jgi:RNA polymerase sigma factor (sigma-70 family)
VIRETSFKISYSFHLYDGSSAAKRDGLHGRRFLKDADWLAERFEAARPRLQRIALRILGSPAESDDALQESWLRISRADISGVANFEGWLTTVVARLCLDALKRRESRREQLTPDDPRRETAAIAPGERPEEEAMLADSIGVALRILLDALPPAELVAFVLHDMFEHAFLQASRSGNFSALLALLDPGATLRADAAVVAMGGAAYWESDRLQAGIEGADAVARAFSGRARAAQPALIDGEPGAVWMHEGELSVAFRFRIKDDRIIAIDLVADRAALAQSVIER